MEEEEYQMGIPNGVGEAMLAHAIDKFDVKLEQTEFGPKLIGSYEELENKNVDFYTNTLVTPKKYIQVKSKDGTIKCYECILTNAKIQDINELEFEISNLVCKTGRDTIEVFEEVMKNNNTVFTEIKFDMVMAYG